MEIIRYYKMTTHFWLYNIDSYSTTTKTYLIVVVLESDFSFVSYHPETNSGRRTDAQTTPITIDLIRRSIGGQWLYPNGVKFLYSFDWKLEQWLYPNRVKFLYSFDWKLE
jgi:hypothetical protein